MSADAPPADGEAVTSSWLTGILRQRGVLTSGSVAAARRRPIGTGQVADAFAFELEYDQPEPTAPRSVVVKLSAADETSRASAAAHRLYEREVRFYEQLAPRVGVRTPACFYAGIDVTTNRFALVLEDLTPVAPVDSLTGLDADRCATALEQAAALHAPLWAAPELATFDWLNPTAAQRELLATALPALMGLFVDRYGDDLGDDSRRLVERLRPLAPRWLDHPDPWTVTHHDFRPDNMLFDGKSGDVPLAIVDWQTVGHGPGLIDVAFVVGTSMEPDERGAHEEALVRDYHQRLVAGGVGGYSWERCWRDYRRCACHALYFLAPATVLVERTERGDAMFLTMIRRATAQIETLESEAALC